MAFGTDRLLWLKHLQRFQPHGAALGRTQKRCPPMGATEVTGDTGRAGRGADRSKAARRRLQDGCRKRNRNKESEEEEQQRKRRCAVEMSSSQPREPQTKPDHRALFPAVKKATVTSYSDA